MNDDETTNGEGLSQQGLSGDALALVKAARSPGIDGPPAAAKARVRSAVALALAGGAVASATGAASAAGAQVTGGAAAGGAATASVAAKVATAAAGTSASATVGSSAIGSSAIGSGLVTSAATGTAAASTGAAVGLFGGLATKVAIAAIAVSAVGGVIAVRSNETSVPERAPIVEARHAVSDEPSAGDSPGHSAEALGVVAPALEAPDLAPMLEPAVEVAPAFAVEPGLTVDPVPAPATTLSVPTLERRVARTAIEAPLVIEVPAAVEPPVAAVEPTEAPSTLLAELPLIARGRAAIERGEPAAALRVAREHASRFPGGAMSEEAAAIEVQALCMADDPGAEAARARFTRAHPGSVYADRIAGACR